MTAIKINKVHFSYKDGFSLSDVSLGIEKGTVSFLLGPNGAGKTTFLKLMYGLLKPKQGHICVFGKDMSTMSHNEIAKHIAVVEQDSQYIFPFTVEEIVLMGRFPYAGNTLFESSQDIAKAEWAMHVTNTLQFRERSILTLSGGERRRVEIARAIAQEADILLLDEPTSHLDIKQQRELYTLLQKLNTENGVTMIVISHHLQFIRDYADGVYFMKDGTLREMPDKEILFNEEALIKKF